MRKGAWALAAFVACLSGCADPHFVHDPQLGFFSKSQLPPLLKSLRCELVTYIAANNQHHILNAYTFNRARTWDDKLRANREFPFFPMDPSRFGGMAIELKIQDSLGTQSGTTADWKRSDPDKIHSRSWHIGPTLSEQNSYDMLMSFLLPQDIYGLDESARPKPEPDELSTDSDQPYLCYRSIPNRLEPVDPKLSNAVFTVQDLDAVAAGSGGEPQFRRILVDGLSPLATWLQSAGTTVTSTSLVQSDAETNEAMVPGQQTYTFTIMTTAALDIKESITTSLWTAVGGEVSGGWQHTGTLTIVLNGADAANTSGVKTGSTQRVSSKQTYPVIQTETVTKYCELPVVGGLRSDSPNCHWPPRPRVQAENERGPKADKGGTVARPNDFKLTDEPLKGAPAIKRAPIAKPLSPAFRDFGSHGTVVYPVPLSPLGAPF